MIKWFFLLNTFVTTNKTKKTNANRAAILNTNTQLF